MKTAFRVWLGTAALAVLMVVGLPGFAAAQRAAGDKITGAAYWPARASARHIESARNFAQEFQTYVTTVAQPDPSVVKDIKTELGRYLDESKKHLVAMTKAYEGNKEALAGIAAVEKELDAAVEYNKAMIACCENQKFDKVGTMACCTDLVKQLDKVHADHVALMKKLGAAK